LSFGLVPNAKHYPTINLSGLQKAKDLIDRLHRITKSGPRKDKHGIDLISDALPFGRLWYDRPDAVSNAIGYAKFRSRSYDAVIRVYDEAGNVIETHEHKGELKSRRFLVTRALPSK
jgi:hypothetical protein